MPGSWRISSCSTSARQTLWGNLFAPLDVTLDEYTAVQPDILFVSGQQKDIVKDVRIDGAPFLVAEILSETSRSKDRLRKRRIYQEAGIQHYWLVDPCERTIECLALRDGSISWPLPGLDETITHPDFPGSAFPCRNCGKTKGYVNLICNSSPDRKGETKLLKRSRQLGEESINKLLVKFSVPAIIGMLVNSLYNIVDRIFVGNGVGSLGLSAITREFPLTLVVMSVALLIGVGSGTCFHSPGGEKKESEAGEILGNAFFLLVILSVLITVVGLAWLDPLMSLLGASAEVLPYARDYAGIILARTVFWTVGMGMNNIIRAEGNPQVAMLTMLIGALLNIVLDAVFIFAFGWGIKGAALATIIAKAVSALWVLHYLLTRSQVRLRLDKIRLRLAHMLRIVAIGFAPFARQLAISLLNVILNISLSTYGGDLAWRPWA